MSQTEIADLLSLPVSIYSRLEHNENSVEADKILSFAQALGIPVHELLPETVSISNNHHYLGNGGAIVFGINIFISRNPTPRFVSHDPK